MNLEDKICEEFKKIKYKDIYSAVIIKNNLNLEISYQEILDIIHKNFKNKLSDRRTYTLNDYYFSDINSQEKAYILGLLAADGYVGNHNEFIISSKDKDILEKIRKEMNISKDLSLGSKGGFENSGRNFEIRLSSKFLVNDLNNLGFYPNKSLTFNTIPNINSDLKRHFLRGYFDGDGSITHYVRTYNVKGKEYSYDRLTMTILATEPLLLEFIKEFNFEKYSFNKSKTPELKYLYISSKEELLHIYNLMYENSSISLNRKREIWEKYIMSL